MLLSKELDKPQDFTTLDSAIRAIFEDPNYKQKESEIQIAVFILTSLKNIINSRFNRDSGILGDFRMTYCASQLEKYENLKEEHALTPGCEKFMTIFNSFRASAQQ